MVFPTEIVSTFMIFFSGFLAFSVHPVSIIQLIMNATSHPVITSFCFILITFCCFL
ncbi:Uncharacterised protein [Segatella copri]|nr:Uncharacterised protein [Segatella copri]